MNFQKSWDIDFQKFLDCDIFLENLKFFQILYFCLTLQEPPPTATAGNVAAVPAHLHQPVVQIHGSRLFGYDIYS